MEKSAASAATLANIRDSTNKNILAFRPLEKNAPDCIAIVGTQSIGQPENLFISRHHQMDALSTESTTVVVSGSTRIPVLFSNI